MTNIANIRADARLTSREYDVLGLIAHGRSNPAIARALGITEDTAKSHVRKLLARLDARDRAHAVAIAYETGILQPGHLGGAATMRPTVEQRLAAVEHTLSRVVQETGITIGRAS